ncbi:hypothetical protein [Ectopseudomonas khazarica]|uniref:hypothetical protein n=1 Tax=Ectopseudomonas khazarica TaxID=2502979 RepID=UPI003B94A67A
MANCILLVFEGEVTEKNIWLSLKRFYLSDPRAPIIYGIYGTEIYSLYHRMAKDPDLDLFSVLKGDQRNAALLKDVSKEDVSEIYLFFDYDGHAAGATDEKLRHMLEFFHEETENGKLYLSYPMVEAIRHINPCIPFGGVVAKCKENIRYKGVVAKATKNPFQDTSRYSEELWQYVISEHCKKLGKLMTDNFQLPTEYYDQTSIFERQLEKHIIPSKEVSVLSAFPIFLLDYYGHSKFCENLERAEYKA